MVMTAIVVAIITIMTLLVVIVIDVISCNDKQSAVVKIAVVATPESWSAREMNVKYLSKVMWKRNDNRRLC